MAADDTWELLDALRRGSHPNRSVDRAEMVAPSHPGRPDPPATAAGRQDGNVRLDAWLELGEGSEEDSEAICEAVGEIVQLQYLFIEAICRHFPAIAPAIRDVAQHLLEDATRLTDLECCQDPTSPARSAERMN